MGVREIAKGRPEGYKSNEWFTPPEWLDRVRVVFGGQIDLDPCSCMEAQKNVQARRWLCKEQDGLARSWHADSVFVNPPYSRGVINLFVDKIVDEWTQASFTQAIILTNACPDTLWWQALHELSVVMAFPRQRIKFLRSDGSYVSPTLPNCFTYLGPNPGYFAFVMQDACSIVKRAHWSEV